MSTQHLPLEGKLIAFFHQSSDMYGSDKILLYLAEGVQKEGGQAVVLLPDTGLLTQALEARGIEFHIVPILKLTRTRFSLKGILALAREMQAAFATYNHVFSTRKVDLVHSNTIAVLGGALWARRKHIPHLWHVHEIIGQPWVAKSLFPWLIKVLADHVVCNSKASYQWLISEQDGLQKKMSVILNGIQAPDQLNEVLVEELHLKFRPNSSKVAIGLVGRINRWKGHNLLMDAVDLLHSKGTSDFSVVFTGSPPIGQEHFEVELKQRIAKSPMSDRILLQGFSSEIWPNYKALDIVCVPSTEPEPFGLVALEAMAMGKPVVASSFGGLVEIVVDGVTGMTFTPCDANALANSLEKLLCDDNIRSGLGAAGKDRFEVEFSVEKMIERFVMTYHGMLVK